MIAMKSQIVKSVIALRTASNDNASDVTIVAGTVECQSLSEVIFSTLWTDRHT
ncbi:hypothetical protein [Robinsoniella peoriensis]|uniref:hypothetical protein n=1 Tax=Robinsoniella peoriensis TaxID=180332 RepID=UPI00366F054D